MPARVPGRPAECIAAELARCKDSRERPATHNRPRLAMPRARNKGKCTQQINALAKLENATKMLAEVRDAHGAKNLMAMASAAEHYARKAKLGEEAIDYAHAIKIDAESLLGGFLKEEVRAVGRPRLNGSTSEPFNASPTLADLNLSKKLSAESQELNAIAEKHPEQFQAIRARKKSVSRVRREVKRAKVSEAASFAASLPDTKYRIIYADPPWQYGDKLTESYGTAEFHYPTMKLDELKALPVQGLCEKESVLFLWATSPMIQEALELCKAWGFAYKAMFVWDKVKHNMGHYNSVRHELLLICTRGSCLPDVPDLIDSVVSVERTKHSRKPEEFRQIIDKLYPHGKRVELFARKETKGWERWGNQA